jgi:hypothetical protein
MFAFWEDIKERQGISKVLSKLIREVVDHGHLQKTFDILGKI